MTKKDFIKNFNLTKTKTKGIFCDGLAQKERVLYISDLGKLFVFYENDLHIVTPYENYIEGMETLDCRLNLGYSCFH